MAGGEAKSNILDPASVLVGRGADCAAIAACFDDGARLVTVLGPGGIGKTRLALRFAGEHAAAYSAHGGGGAWLCTLVDARSGMAVCAVVGATLGVVLDRNTQLGPVVTELGAAIARRKRILIVLDNVDPLASEVAAILEVWMGLAPRARFLATSRSALDLPGEQLWPLAGLATPPPGTTSAHALAADAVELFVRRARQVRPDLPLGERDIEAIAEIVRRLDGAPLAIELAAARSKVLSPTQILERLAQPLELLVRPGDTSRHGSMRAVVLDSVRTLDASTRACFAGCAIFRGGFTLEAAQAVLAAPGQDVLEMLETASQQSLVRTVTMPELDEPRFVLYETLREVAAELLANEPDGTVLGRRHSRYFAALGQEWAARAEQADPRALSTLATELENLVDAHAFAIAAPPDFAGGGLALTIALSLEPLLAMRGLWRLRLRLLDQAIVASGMDAATTAERAAAFLARGSAHRELGAFDLARSDLLHGQRLAAAAGAPIVEALAELRLGELVEVSGATGDARACFQRALARLATAPPSRAVQVREAEIRAHLGHALRREGELEQAHAELVQALALFRATGTSHGVASTGYELGVIALFRMELGEAALRFDEAREIARTLGARQLEAAITSGLGCLLQERGDLDGAVASHAAAVQTFRDLGNRHREASALYYLGCASLERGELAQAEAVLVTAGQVVAEVGAPRYQALIAGARAAGHALAGDLALASAALASADVALAACTSEPSLDATVALHRLHVELAETTASSRASVLERARALARKHLGDDPRFALRVLERSGVSADRGSALVVRLGMMGFRVPGAAEDVDLARRPTLRRLLAALAVHRRDAPGDALALDDLLAAGWPGETIGHEAAANRVHVALTTLRKLGLRDVLRSGPRGYSFDPTVAILIEELGVA